MGQLIRATPALRAHQRAVTADVRRAAHLIDSGLHAFGTMAHDPL